MTKIGRRSAKIMRIKSSSKLLILKSSGLPSYIERYISQKSRRRLDEWRKHELANGTGVTCVMCFPGLRICAGCRCFIAMIMKNLHHGQGHECHQQHPCKPNPMYSISPHAHSYLIRRKDRKPLVAKTPKNYQKTPKNYHFTVFSLF